MRKIFLQELINLVISIKSTFGDIFDLFKVFLEMKMGLLEKRNALKRSIINVVDVFEAFDTSYLAVSEIDFIPSVLNVIHFWV